MKREKVLLVKASQEIYNAFFEKGWDNEGDTVCDKYDEKWRCL